MDRSKNIPSTQEEVPRNTKRVAKALAANKQPAIFINNCWLAADVTAAMLVDKNKAFSSAGNLTLLSCKFCKNVFYCFDHQHGRLVMWLQPSNGHELNRQQKMTDTDHRGLVILPYAKGFFKKVANVLRCFNMKVSLTPIRTISAHLKHTKKSQKTRSRKRLPEESCTRSNVKIVMVSTLVRHHAH